MLPVHQGGDRRGQQHRRISRAGKLRKAETLDVAITKVLIPLEQRTGRITFEAKLLIILADIVDK